MENRQNKPNHLIGQKSPYLLQHLYNPVDWYAWGEEALEKAACEDKPVIVSIGYSACHWCHVMEEESFQDMEVAELMNRYFICIKVDREERPDIDHMYMTAVQILTRQGGWPLNCFALPDTKPFWGGTYFSKDQWKSILQQVADIYKNRRNELEDQAEQLVKGIAASSFVPVSETSAAFKVTDAERVFNNVMKFMDSREGGAKGAPKFPLPVNQEFLLRYHYFSNNRSALDHVDLTLEKMAMGGIYDQIGGGFARYSTDDIWKVPHFEKMLYDNGQLVSVYSNAWKVLKKPLFKSVVYQTIEFVERELTSPEGTFYSALDADSEGEEGKFYLWHEKDIDYVLGDDASLIKNYYQFGKKGYWENDKNILLRDHTDEDYAQKINMPVDKLRQVIGRANRKLLSFRSKRVRPGLDNKVITSWNALMISGLADACAAFGEKSFIEKARRAADFFIDNSISPEGKIYRFIKSNKPSVDGFLEDYALFIRSLIRLFEITAETRYLFKAKDLTGYVMHNFSSAGTSLFSFSSNQGEMLKAPFYELPDNVIPSSNSVMAMNLFHLAGYFGNREQESHSYKMLEDIHPHLAGQSINYTNWASLLLCRTYHNYTMVITGPGMESNLKEINSLFIPSVKVAGSSVEEPGIPVFRGRGKEGEPWFYLCTMDRCDVPVNDLSLALEQIKK